MEGPKNPMEIQVTFPEHLKGGVYSNNMTVTHTREEFVLDFLMVAPPPAPSPRGSSSPPATPNGSSQRSRKISGSTRRRTGRSSRPRSRRGRSASTERGGSPRLSPLEPGGPLLQERPDPLPEIPAPRAPGD